MRLWQWLSGKKTAFGAAFLLGALFGDQVLVGIWHASVDWLAPLIDTLKWAGAILTSGGLIHKATKRKLDTSDSRGHGVKEL
jgi:hypothetical protein